MNPHIPFHTAIYGDPIDALTAIREIREILANAELDHVMTLRRHGASWAFIARQLGISRQATHERFAHWETPTPT